MLKKVIKYDLLNDYKKYLGTFALLMVFTIIIKVLQMDVIENANPVVIEVIIAIVTSIIGFLCAITIIMPIAYSLERYNTCFNKDEAYLYQTLPIKTWHMTLSNAIVTYIWLFAAIIMVAAAESIYAWDISWLKSIFELKIIFNGTDAFGKFPLVMFIIMLLASPFTLMSSIYLGNALGYLLPKAKKACSVMYFLALNIAFGYVCKLMFDVMDYISTKNVEMEQTAVRVFLIALFIWQAIFTAICFLGANKILTDKINLE